MNIPAKVWAVLGLALVPVAAQAALELNPRGRFHLDVAFNEDDATELADGFLNRRARLGVDGKLDDDWSFIIEYDFAENDTSAKDVYVSRKLFGGTIKIGQSKVPFSLNELTSSNRLTFIERATPNNLVADAFRLGVNYERNFGKSGVAGMLYGRAIGDNQRDGDMSLGAALRYYVNPLQGKAPLLHFGFALAYEDRRDFDSVRLRDRPESRASSGTRLIDTGTIADVESTLKAGVELAFQTGSFSSQAEYFYVDLSRDEQTSPQFDGYYAQASYVLTGEQRDYRNGVMRTVTPKSPSGAWEVAARYSSANLNSSNAQIFGGRQSNITLGLNWYASRSVRFMTNVIFVRVDGGVAEVDDEPTIIAARAQYSF